jgi:hypothetical protein
MAAPETQFQPAGLQAPMIYPTHVPMMAIQQPGYNWDIIGKTALAGLGQMTNMLPYINPGARAQYALQQASAQTGQEALRQIRESGYQGYLGGVVGGEYRTIPGAQAGVSFKTAFGPGGPGSDQDGGKASNNQPPNKSNSYYRQPVTPALSPEVANQGPNAAHPNAAPVIVAPGQSGGSREQPQVPVGAPSVTDQNFNLQSGQNITASQVLPPAYAQAAAQGDTGGLFAPPAYPARAIPPAPNQLDQAAMTAALAPNRVPSAGGQTAQLSAAAGPGPIPPQQPPSQGAQAQQLAGQQASMVNWLNQNAHPVASSQDALAWAKMFDTRAQSATYLPHGGPGGEPAFSFAGKGFSNTVPLSMMVRNGFQGAVAGQNTAATLHAAEQAQGQQQPGAQPMPAGQQPPAGAPPGAQPSDEQLRAQLAQYTNVPSTGGPPPQYMVAQASGANLPPTAPGHADAVNPNGTLRQGYGFDDDHNPTGTDGARTYTGVSWDQIHQQAAAADQKMQDRNYANSVERNPNFPQDYVVARSPSGYNFYRSHDDAGNPGPEYAKRPADDIWGEDRLYWPYDHWEHKTLPDNLLNQHLSEWDPSLSYERIRNMSEDEKVMRLEQAFYIKNILPYSDKPVPPEVSKDMDAEKDAIQTSSRILHWTEQPKFQDPRSYNQAALDINHAAIAASQSAPVAGNTGWLNYWNTAKNWWEQHMAGYKPGGQPVVPDNDMIELEGEHNHLLNLLPKNKVDHNQAVTGELGQLNFGTDGYVNRVKDFRTRATIAFQRDVNAALMRREAVRPEDMAFSKDLVTKPDLIHDPVDRNPRAGAATHPTPAPYNAGPAATPTPTPGSTRDNAIQVNTQRDFDSLPDNLSPQGTWFRDSHGTLSLKRPKPSQ